MKERKRSAIEEMVWTLLPLLVGWAIVQLSALQFDQTKHQVVIGAIIACLKGLQWYFTGTGGKLARRR